MTVKQKANDLMDRFTEILWDSYSSKDKPMIKQLAATAVDEILNNKSLILDYVSGGPNSKLMCSTEYWESVKQELQNL